MCSFQKQLQSVIVVCFFLLETFKHAEVPFANMQNMGILKYGNYEFPHMLKFVPYFFT